MNCTTSHTIHCTGIINMCTQCTYTSNQFCISACASSFSCSAQHFMNNYFFLCHRVCGADAAKIIGGAYTYTHTHTRVHEPCPCTCIYTNCACTRTHVHVCAQEAIRTTCRFTFSCLSSCLVHVHVYIHVYCSH